MLTIRAVAATIHGVAVTTRGAAAATIRGVAATIRDVAAMIRGVAVMNRGAAVMKASQKPSLRLSRFLIFGIAGYFYDAPCIHCSTVAASKIAERGSLIYGTVRTERATQPRKIG